uniref:Dynamin-binding protein n=1 Tax=Panagrolaimus sp. ES5 TaxID=591445 RepID=A0AC34GPF2_9BILA
MNLSSPAFLARCAVTKHASGLQVGEIFIVERIDESKNLFNGRSLNGETFNEKFEKGDFDKLDLPSGRYVVSMGEYESIQPGHLSFMQFTLLNVEEDIDDNWMKGYVTLDSGKKLGKCGLFPKSIVAELPTIEQPKTQVGVVIEKLIPQIEGEIALSKDECVHILEANDEWYTVQTANGAVGKCPKTFLKIVADGIVEELATTNPEPYCTALYEFIAEHDSECSFIVGDILKLFRWIDVDWLEGENQRTGKNGFIPASFVQIIVAPRGMEQQITGESIKSKNAEELSTIGIATVLYAFEARYGDELSVDAGTSIKVLGIQGDWVKCWNPETDEVGIIPRGYLRVFQDYEDESGSDSRATASLISNFSEVESPTVTEKPWITYDVEKPLTTSSSVPSFIQEAQEIEHNKIPPERPPPPKFHTPLFPTDNGLQLRKIQHPVQRTAPSRPKSMTKITTVSPSDDDKGAEGWEARRTKVLEEIIQSETSYLFDLTAWEDAIESNPLLPEKKKKVILHGYNLLKYLSRTLTTALVAEQAKSVCDQELGLRFMELKEVFYKTYGQYFRSAEQISELIVKGDDQIQRALQDSVNVLRSKGSNVFDVPTALSRPIQRCLRYPLYIGEIVKNTPLTHADHPKLMEALRQMGQLATKMNESKRRKELTKKYSKMAVEQRESGFFNRLSKFNFHSLIKKSSRLQYRISSKIGFSTTFHDEEFNQMLKTLNEVQQRFCHLIYQMTVYKNRIVRLAKKYVEMNTVEKAITTSAAVSQFEHNSLIRRLLNYAEELEKEIIELCNSAHDLIKRDFTFIVHKRYDKLADWEMAVRSKKPQEVVDMRRCEFQALNNQLKLVIPKETDKLIDGLLKYVRRIRQTDTIFFKRVKTWMEQFSNSSLIDFQKYVDPRNQRLHQIENTLRTKNPRINSRLMEKETELQKRPIALPDPDNSIQPPLMYDKPILGRSQTQAERESLIRTCRALGLHDSLCKVTKDYSSKDGKFILKKGDVIRERYQKSNHSLVENGLATYSIPTNIYQKVKNPFSPKLANSSSFGENDSEEEEKNEQNMQIFFNLQDKKDNIHEGVKFRKEESRQKSFGIPENVVFKLTAEKQQPNNRESVNWLQYDDKIVDLPSFEDYNRAAPAPPESLKTWTTFENDNDTPRAIVPPHAIFGSLSNPIPMEPQPLPSTVTHFPAEETIPSRRAPPPPLPEIATSPSNPFGNVDFLNLSKPLPSQSYSLQKPSIKYSEPDPLSKLVKEEIERTRQSKNTNRNQSASPILPPAPSEPPPAPPKFSADAPLPSIQNGSTAPPPRPSHLFPNNHDLNSPKSQYATQKPNNEKANANELVISQYDFTPDDETVQLKIFEGERLLVIKPYDDANNSEWWLVKNQKNQSGYVPSSYLSKI